MTDLEDDESPRDGEYLSSSGWTVGFVLDVIEGVYFLVDGFFSLLGFLVHLMS